MTDGIAAGPGTKNGTAVSKQGMTKKSLPTKLSLFLGVAALLFGPTLQAAQQTEGNQAKGVVGGKSRASLVAKSRALLAARSRASSAARSRVSLAAR
jgi:hypothetical protein